MITTISPVPVFVIFLYKSTNSTLLFFQDFTKKSLASQLYGYIFYLFRKVDFGGTREEKRTQDYSRAVAPVHFPRHSELQKFLKYISVNWFTLFKEKIAENFYHGWVESDFTLL